MPRIRTLNTKRAPEGWDDVAPQLEEFQNQMRDAVNEPHEGKRRNEATWPITKIHYERSRYIYELYYKKKAISRELYDWLLKEKYGDAALIAKWKKPGYEYLCSLSAIDKRNSNFGTTAICRVPLHLRKPGSTGPCVTTGCISCASQEAGRLGGPIWWDSPRPADLVGWAKAGCPTQDKPGKKRKGVPTDDDLDAELEARAAALRKGSHAGVRDDEAAALEATVRALRGRGEAAGSLRGLDDDEEEEGAIPEEEDDDITGDEMPVEKKRPIHSVLGGSADAPPPPPPGSGGGHAPSPPPPPEEGDGDHDAIAEARHATPSPDSPEYDPFDGNDEEEP